MSGVVLDQTTHAPIVLARIRTNDGRVGALSTTQGNYVMPHRSGTYQITATADGYHAFTGQVVVAELAVTTSDISMVPIEAKQINQIPTASLTVSPPSGETNTSFQFDASGSSDTESQQEHTGQPEQQHRFPRCFRAASTGDRQSLCHYGVIERPLPVPARYPAPRLKDYLGRTCLSPGVR